MISLSGSPKRRLQSGVAAIEFALVFSLLLAFIYGIVTFGAVLYTQQAVSRAAEDGARAMMAFNGPITTATVTVVENIVYESLAVSLVGPSGATSTADRKDWLIQQQPKIVNVETSGLVQVRYPYEKNRILNLNEAWVPKFIIGTAKMAL